MSTVTNPKGGRVYPPGSTPASWAATYLSSNVGSKFLVALTGLGLTSFLVIHMVGNLKIFSGPESLNRYAYFLKHDIGVIVWAARAGLLGIFALHIYLTLRLKLKVQAARPTGYHFRRYAQATIQSRTMWLTGLTVGLFTAFHLAHYTFGLVHDAILPNGTHVNYLELRDAKGYHDVYSMVVAGFTTPWISGLYIAANLVLFLHLSHGIQSSLQTLGLVGRRFTRAAKALGYAVTLLIVGGNLAIVGCVWAGVVEPGVPLAYPQPQK